MNESLKAEFPLEAEEVPEHVHFYGGFKIHFDIGFCKKTIIRVGENQIKKSFVRIKHSVCLTLSPTARTDGFVKNNFWLPYINQTARPIAGSSGGLQSNRACPDGFVPRAEARACPTRYIR